MVGISNISGCVGNQLNFAITDTNGSVLINSNELPQNTLFISAPQNEAGMDNGIYSIFKLSDKEKKEMSNRCRVLAVETYSYKVTVDRFLQQFAEYQNTNR